MARIVAAHVDNDAHVERLRNALAARGVAASDIQRFYTPPAGQHGTYPTGGDVHTDPGARAAPRTQRAGVAIGAAIGAVIGLLVGGAAAEYTPLAGIATLPLITVLAAAIGAFLGAVQGTMRGLSEAKPQVTGGDRAAQRTGARTAAQTAAQAARASGRTPTAVRRGGLMLAVCVRGSVGERTVIEVLRQGGGRDIEWADGRWEAGGWADFDPLSEPRLVDLHQTLRSPQQATAARH